MKPIVFVVGGCRSGKSRHALEVAERLGGHKNIFIATCRPQDAEMQARVAAHRRQRGADWQTVEEPLDMAGAIAENSRRADVVLIDCLTLWVSNLMLENDEGQIIAGDLVQLIEAVEKAPCPVVMVSNEVGTGIVPENSLARRYRDLVGAVNQAVAKCATRVIWMVAGIAVTIKG